MGVSLKWNCFFYNFDGAGPGLPPQLFYADFGAMQQQAQAAIVIYFLHFGFVVPKFAAVPEKARVACKIVALSFNFF